MVGKGRGFAALVKRQNPAIKARPIVKF